MKRSFVIGVAALAMMGLFGQAALAGSPHFVGIPTVTTSESTATVSGKVAGLGNETQIHVEASGEVACLNPGQQFPDAANKMTVTAGGDFPVQNGKSYFELTLTATFQPKCVPPMTLVWGPITITVSGSTFEAFSTTITP